MGFNNENIILFMNELSGFMLTDSRDVNFRRKTLELIEKYFKIKKSIFVLYHDDYFSDVNKISSLQDIITHGISSKSIKEFYKKYTFVDDLYINLSLQNPVTRLSDSLKNKEKEGLIPYEMYYLKYKSAYQVTMGLFFQKRIIGAISLTRSLTEQDFSDDELKYIEVIQKYLSNESKKIIRYERIVLENGVLQGQEELFPVALIVLDENYNVIFKNKESTELIKDVFDTKVSSFKYYFINEIVSNDYINDSDQDNIFEINNCQFRVIKKYGKLNDKESESRLLFFVYMAKNFFETEDYVSEYYTLLTNREKEISQLIRKGFTNNEISEKLHISQFTVKTHLQSLYNKCDVNNKLKLIYKLFK